MHKATFLLRCFRNYEKKSIFVCLVCFDTGSCCVALSGLVPSLASESQGSTVDLLFQHLQGWDYKPSRPFVFYLVFLCFIEDLAYIFIIDISLYFLSDFGIKVML